MIFHLCREFVSSFISTCRPYIYQVAGVLSQVGVMSLLKRRDGRYSSIGDDKTQILTLSEVFPFLCCIIVK